MPDELRAAYARRTTASLVDDVRSIANTPHRWPRDDQWALLHAVADRLESVRDLDHRVEHVHLGDIERLHIGEG